MLERFTPLKSTDDRTILDVYLLLEAAHQRVGVGIKPNVALRELVQSSQDSEFYIARDLDEHVAVMGLYNFTRINGTATIEALAVRPEHRGQKLGNRALSELMTFAKDDGAHRIQVYAASSSVGFYERQGFTRGETTKRYLHMTKELLTI